MSLLEFYQMFAANRPDVIIPSSTLDVPTGHFNVFKRLGYCTLNPSPYNRRDFYKISLILGKGVLHYPHEKIVIDGPALLFNNPTIPYSWETTSEFQSGYFCLFNDSFMRQHSPSNDSLLVKIQDVPVFYLDELQVMTISAIFEKMLAEIDTDYLYKYDLLRNYVNLMIHEAMKMQPREDPAGKTHNAASRLSSLFFELLERQFPVYSSDHVLEIRTANAFAERLNVHVNHLNHAVKEVTGKTTSDHISKRIANEAISLLKHTEWNVSEIGYCLGFEYPANFNMFFKRQTTIAPKSFREAHHELADPKKR